MVISHNTLNFFATAPKGMEGLLAQELLALGASTSAETRAGVSFSGDLRLAYRVCLWSRLANRILLPVATFPAPTPEDLYAGAHDIAWHEQLSTDHTLAVDFTSTQSKITHTHYGALKVKDAIVDALRTRSGARPSVAREHPDVRINVHVQRDQATLSIDLSGDSLHRRGYRRAAGAAPLKENLAAAILMRAGWPDIARAGGALVDPMCGSGTLPIEAALLAGDIAPGLLRRYFGFLRWLGHEPAVWTDLLAEAEERKLQGLKHLPPILGFDAHPKAVRNAQDNVRAAGMEQYIRIGVCELKNLTPPALPTGLVVVNPPYGERLGEVEALRDLYQTLGAQLKAHFVDWKAAVFTGNPELGKHMGIRARKMHALYNGAIECKLLHFDIDPQWYSGAQAAQLQRERPEKAASAAAPPASAGAEMFANRLRKNLQHIGRWAQRAGIECYRLYDADLPEYALAVDVYGPWLHVQEYAAPKTVDPNKAAQRLREALQVIPSVLNLPREHVFLKVRQKQKGKAQYEKQAATGQFYEVREGPAKFWVNFTDYLDTGLFLDHRLTRALLQTLAKDKSFLNLFAYTGTATVYAALGGATSTTTVDMSNTYLNWAQRNLALNGISGAQHRFIQADCLAWIKQESARYDLIFLDPPTFSTSKRMAGTLDILRDHVEMLRAVIRLLTPSGVLIFSTNHQGFKLDEAALQAMPVHYENISRATLPKDFERNPRIHQCWKIMRAGTSV